VSFNHKTPEKTNQWQFGRRCMWCKQS